MSQKLPIYTFQWIKDTSQFNEDFIKKNHEESDEWYVLEVGWFISFHFFILFDMVENDETK